MAGKSQLQLIYELSEDLRKLYEKYNSFERREALSHCIDLLDNCQYSVLKTLWDEQKKARDDIKGEK